MVSYFFAVDFEMLSETERKIIRVIAEHSSSTSNTIQDSVFVLEADRLSGLLFRLEHLGYIRRNEQRSVRSRELLLSQMVQGAGPSG